MERCRGLTGFLLGHRFSHVEESECEWYPQDVFTMSVLSKPQLRAEKRNYVHTVCMRCGMKISRDKPFNGIFEKADA